MSQRQTVLSLMVATSPECRDCRTTSATLKRDNGRSCAAGGSQASALIGMTTSGEESSGPPRARLIFQSLQAAFEEALAPPAHDFSAGMQAGGNCLIAQPRGGSGGAAAAIAITAMD